MMLSLYRSLGFSSLLLLAACSGGGEANEMGAEEPTGARSAAAQDNGGAPETPLEPQSPSPPGAPGAPDATPVSETPFSPESAQGAASVLQAYYGLIEDGKYAEAWALRWPSAQGASAADFAASFDQYAEYHALVGTPSEISGATGSLYVEVPVQTYGRLKDGTPFSSAGTVTMRRSNNVPGSTPEQRRWRIYTND